MKKDLPPDRGPSSRAISFRFTRHRGEIETRRKFHSRGKNATTRMRTLLEMQVRNCRSGLAREEGILAITTPRYACAYRTCSVSLLSLELSEPEERKYEDWRDTRSRIDSVASNLSTDWPNSWRRTRSISAIRVIVALNEHEGQRCRADGGIGVL